MSEWANTLSDVIQDRAPSTTDTVLNLTTGNSFTAEVETNLDPFSIPEALGDDPREKIRIYVSSAVAVSRNDRVQIQFNGGTSIFQVVWGYYSPASLMSKYICSEVIAKDQA